MLFAQFGDLHTISENYNNPRDIQSADLDGDGDQDVVYINGDNISWQENEDGLGTYDPSVSLKNGFLYGKTIHVADIDSDGDLDIIGGNGNGTAVDELFILMNSNATFSTEILVSGDIEEPRRIKTYDIDDDGDLDIVAISSHDDILSWHENLQGDGTQWMENIIDFELGEGLDFQLADFNNDGKIDIVTASKFGPINNYETIKWYYHTNTPGVFQNSGEEIDGPSNSTDLAVFDADDDGDIDLVISYYNSHVINIIRNDGSGGFDGFSELASSTDIQKPVDVFVSDVDLDGDKDVVMASSASGWQKVAYVENEDGFNGTLNFEVMIEEDNIVGNSLIIQATRSIVPSDVDGDGDEDVIIASYERDKIYWLENTTNMPVGIHEITTANILESFPNPTSGKLNVVLKDPTSSEIGVQIFTSIGQLIIQHKVDGSNGSFVLDPVDYPIGSYFMRVDVDGLEYLSRFVVVE